MWLFSRKGSSGFSGYSTAEEVTQGINGNGLTAIVTDSRGPACVGFPACGSEAEVSLVLEGTAGKGFPAGLPECKVGCCDVGPAGADKA
uniref:Uncharacterized protein n=1 Tax=Chenopodium quinoa TaxID=63459 RepID=A0A803MKP0_CHEQI